jgi:transposase
MPAKQYSVMLDQDQRESLIGLISTGNRDAARKLTRARILLKADEGEFGPAYADKQIQEAVEVSLSTIERTRKTFVREGLEAALTPKKPSKPSRPKKFDGEKEAHLIALACSDPPEGSACWTLRLLAEKMVELHHFSSISHECIRQVLKKTNCALGASSAGVFPELPRKHS